MCAHIGEEDKTVMDSESSKARWLTTGNPEEILHLSDSNCHKGMTLSLSPHMCLPTRTLFPPNKHFTCFPTFHFCMGIHFYKAGGPVPHHWPLALLVWWLVFSALGLTLVSGVSGFRLWYQNPASRHCRLRPTKPRTAVVFQEVKKRKVAHFLCMASWDWEGPKLWNPRGLDTWACSDHAFWYSSPLCRFGPNRTVKWQSAQGRPPLRFSLASDVISCRRAAETIHQAGLLLWEIQGIVQRISLPTFPSLFLSHLSLLPWKISHRHEKEKENKVPLYLPVRYSEPLMSILFHLYPSLSTPTTGLFHSKF